MKIAGYSLLANPERDDYRSPMERELLYLPEAGSEDEKIAMKRALMIMAGFLGLGILISRM